jgi:hypothetical protein
MVLAESAAWSPASITGTADGKTLLLVFMDSNITIADSAPFDLSAAFTSSAGAALQLIWTGTAWRELWRSPVVVPAETDPLVSAWAKAATKPTYTYSEVGAQVAGSYLTAEADTLDTVAGRSGSTTQPITVDPGAQGAASPPAAAFTAADGTLATVGNPVQVSPSYTWTSSAWNTTTSTADVYTWGVWVTPANGATTTATWKLGVSKNGAAWTFPMTVANTGSVTCIGTIVAPGFSGSSGTSYFNAAILSIPTPSASQGIGQRVGITGLSATSNVVVIDLANDNRGRNSAVADTSVPLMGVVESNTGGVMFGGLTLVNCGPAAISRGDHLIVSTACDGCAMAGTESSDLYRLGVALSAKAAGDNAAYVSHTTATPGVVTVNGTASTWAANQRVVLMGGTWGGLTQGQAYYVRNPAGAPTTSCELSLTSGGASVAMTSAAASGSPTLEPTGTVSVWLK